MDYHLTLWGKIVPKARPRVTKNGTYLPEKYRKWREDSTKRLKIEWQLNTLLCAEISLVVFGSHRGDPDNIAGAILDSLVEAKILKNDTLKNIPSLSLRADSQDDRKQTPGVLIKITPLKWEEIPPPELNLEPALSDYPL